MTMPRYVMIPSCFTREVAAPDFGRLISAATTAVAVIIGSSKASLERQESHPYPYPCRRVGGRWEGFVEDDSRDFELWILHLRLTRIRHCYNFVRMFHNMKYLSLLLLSNHFLTIFYIS